MADEHIDTVSLELFDRWPGPAIAKGETPTDGWLGSSHHNVATTVDQPIPLGTKIAVYNSGASKGVAGWGTMIYLQVGTQNTSTPIAAGGVVIPETTTPYKVTNAYTSGLLLAGKVAIAISAMTDAKTGWFWCGGICPSDMVHTGTTYPLDGAVVHTDGTVAAGQNVGLKRGGTDTSVAVLTPWTVVSTTACPMPVGLAHAADAA